MNFDRGKLVDNLYLLKQKIVESLGALFGIFFFRVYFILAALINLFCWFFVFLIRSRIATDSAILHYNIDFGVNLIGTSNQLFTIPLLGLLILLMNSAAARIIIKRKVDKFLLHFLGGSAGIANFFLLIALSFLYLINSR